MQNTIAYIILGVISVTVLLPVLYAVLGSFKSTREILTEGGLLPKIFTFENYIDAFKKGHFEKYTLNSIIIAVSDTFIGLFNITAVGFCFARSNFFGKKLLKTMILLTMFIALGPMTLYPVITVIRGMGLQNSIWGIVIGLVTGMGSGVFIFEAFFKSQGGEIDEAAVIDGCNFFQRYFFIALPLCKPLIATYSVLIFSSAWNSFFLPYILTFNRIQNQPLSVAIVSLMDMGGEGSTAWGLLFAGACLAIIPVLLVYSFTSRWFIKGITEGAVKF
ncbi:MAG: carbohydrate ABC transporter permease [Chitinophagaceae bacterium]|nr:carbohydrate ABC transporter permease [Chitinophagaceae bacterium]